MIVDSAAFLFIKACFYCYHGTQMQDLNLEAKDPIQLSKLPVILIQRKPGCRKFVSIVDSGNKDCKYFLTSLWDRLTTLFEWSGKR